MHAHPYQLSRLRANIKPFRLYWFSHLRSTNDQAARLRKAGELFAPALVVTSHQIAGRGRGGNSWWSARGCLTVTFVIPIGTVLAPYQLPLVAGLAVRAAAAELTGDDAILLKWPNDLLHDGRKLAGLLCERIHKADLIGLGLNVDVDVRSAPPPLRDSIACLSQIAGQPLDMTDVLIAVARHLHALLRRCEERPFAQLLHEYDAHHALRGKRVRVADALDGSVVAGRCEGLDDMGRLLLRDGRTLHHVIAGEVRAIS
jgi:BirA family biotin operon repressor/biotin-[acetyl-CoA-carboxylase] ligase